MDAKIPRLVFRTQNRFFSLFDSSPNEPTLNFTTEGCFCPDGMKLFNKESGVCVDKCGKADIFSSVAELISQNPSWIFLQDCSCLCRMSGP